MERFVERFRYKATKARQAQSKLKVIERLQARRDRARAARRAHAGLLVRRRRALRPGGARARGRDDRRRRSDPDRATPRCGSSGASTSAWSAPTGPARRRWWRRWSVERELRGRSCSRGHNVGLGYLSQHAESAGDAGAHRARPRPAVDRAVGGEDARALLGRFLFSGEEVEKRVDAISGGEAQRLALAIADELRRQPAGPRRADQPPRPREPRGARGRAHRVRRDPAADLARPGAAGGGRQPHARDRGPAPAQPSGRLGGVPRAAEEAAARRARASAAGAEAPSPARRGRARTASAELAAAGARGRGGGGGA